MVNPNSAYMSAALTLWAIIVFLDGGISESAGKKLTGHDCVL